MRKCTKCNSEFVCWNWFHSPFWKRWKYCFFRNDKFPYFLWQFWQLFNCWGSECWNCSNVAQTWFKVRDGISYEELKTKFVHLPRHALREHIEELWWIQDQSKYFTINERHKYERRRDDALKAIKETLDAQWELDNSVRPSPTPEDAKYAKHFHSARILKALEE